MKPALSLLTIVAVASAYACAAVSISPIEFRGQQNIIVWDAQTRTQHFIRIAGFQSKGPEMGFLAPTPSVPELKEVDQKVFEHLAGLLPVYAGPPAEGVSGGTKGEPAAGGVSIVQETRVGNFLATTFKATDANALGEYLKKYGFKISGDQSNWVKKYVAQQWYITAFQVVIQNQQGSTQPIRMTFKTDTPFNPYYVPADNIGPYTVGLSLYFISKGTYEGKVGGTTAWEGNRFGKIDIPEADRAKIASYLKIDPEQVGDSLTYDVDYAFPLRGNTEDLFFTLADAATPTMPDNYVRRRDFDSRGQRSANTLVYTGLGFVGVLGFAAWMLNRRK